MSRLEREALREIRGDGSRGWKGDKVGFLHLMNNSQQISVFET